MSFFEKMLWDLNLRLYSLKKENHELRNIAIEITKKCNLRCLHCYMNSQAEVDGELNLGDWRKFFENIKTVFGNKIGIQITGGEPFSRSDIFDILSCARELGFRTAIVSNAMFLDKDKIEKLKELSISLSVSLDGFRGSHNYLRNADIFDKVVDNIKLAVNVELPTVAVKTVVHRKNFGELVEFYDFIKDLNIDVWHLFAMEPAGRGKYNTGEVISFDEYKKLCDFVDIIKQDSSVGPRVLFEEQSGSILGKGTLDCNRYKLCGAGISSCAILSNGDVVNCVQGNREIIYGNIKLDDFVKIWHNEFGYNRSREYRGCRKHYFS